MLIRRLTGLLLLLMLGWALNACTAQESFQNAEQCRKVEIGMSQEQVRGVMGAPTGDDATADGGHVWSYLFGSATDTQPIKITFASDGRVVSKTCAPEAQGDQRPSNDDRPGD
ncbi:outer membrane protein assembly factor BamE [Hymenobacter gummosus]|uniref:Outer membrane protein assembly factor BamE n=1 Tax=Hymenobacter gummosus TaxID=1776032 RepID=A0A431TU19_9BACT|nr:outer membrane protein assembly factor BamE [Hymenobacter gummosus]RTQ44865.1 outer membrane protein assembly factor BamE [Hymenobacter gummosus]